MSYNKLFDVAAYITRGTEEEIFKDYFTSCNTASEKARTTVQCELNILYGDKNSNQKLDVYGTDLPGESPIVALMHGGGWVMGDRKEYGFIAEQLYKHGIVTVNIGYDLCPKVTVTKIMKQIEHAAKKVISYAKGRNSRGVYFGGHSAGAQLASSLLFSSLYRHLGADQKLFRGVILISGLYELTPLVPLKNFADTHLTEAEAKTSSPALILPSILKEIPSTRVMFAVGENESPVFGSQAKDLQKMLEGAGWQTKYVEIKGIDHLNIISLFADEKNSLQKDMIKFIKG